MTLTQISITEVATLLILLFTALTPIGLFIWKNRKDRGKLRVRCSPRHSINPVHNDVEYDEIMWTMTNIGSNPVQVLFVGGSHKDGEVFRIPDDELPKMLNPNDFHVTTSRYFRDLISEGVRSCVAVDTLGRRYRASKKDVKKVNAFLKRMREKGPD